MKGKVGETDPGSTDDPEEEASENQSREVRSVYKSEQLAA